MISNRAINAMIGSDLTSTLKAKLVAKQTELLSLAQEVSIEETAVQHLCKQVERKRLEANEVSSEWTEKSGALLWKKN
ncbi:hypothetical protein EYC80_002695 [Monilinia laxa]|uniref:Uncharacterized protein n=1 Tax=Monilinia laxa TaxID=61186 RepID=A0A5N6K4X8_MONLA|nr:hypothetical protein EYC80_002695 [Monilinia laxa]